MKTFEPLVLTHLKAITNPLLNPLQLAHRANSTYARILFVDCSSAFNTIAPALLQDKLSQLSIPESTCRWITDFLTDRKQHVWLGKLVWEPRPISTGAPQGCVLYPLLFSLYTKSCTSSHPSVKHLKFSDDTTLIGLISNVDVSAYRKEVDHLSTWCSQNNLEPNALKTIPGWDNNLTRPSWVGNITSIIKAQLRMFFLRQLKKFNLLQKIMVQSIQGLRHKNNQEAMDGKPLFQQNIL
ncbi:putative RNA-directed DNA polymerase from transposon BS [Merluccius polli]|uniref:RNA-directed DNA polymerase from transposon BS n=1 Tax=Merluccius polli TaxID=89951 RepID=A0AA47N2R9_MERPO|nr:putative RNA-directed DNA polymerase from transposon BS [Merluccius polli]